MGKLIEVSDEQYQLLIKRAGEIQQKKGKPTSIKEAVQYYINNSGIND